MVTSNKSFKMMCNCAQSELLFCLCNYRTNTEQKQKHKVHRLGISNFYKYISNSKTANQKLNSQNQHAVKTAP